MVGDSRLLTACSRGSSDTGLTFKDKKEPTWMNSGCS